MKKIVFAFFAVALISCSGMPTGGLSDKKKQKLLDKANSGDPAALRRVSSPDNFYTDFPIEIRRHAFQQALDSAYSWAIEHKIKQAESAKNWKEYIEWYHYGVKKGSVYHIRELAIKHLKGDLVKKDTLRAIELFQMAIEKHDNVSRQRLRAITGEKVPALVDFYEELRDRWYSEGKGTAPAKLIITWHGSRGAIIRTGFGFDSMALNIVAWISTPLLFIVLFIFCFSLYKGFEDRFEVLFTYAAPLYCVFLGIYGYLFWRSEGIESLGSLSATGSGFISTLTVLLSIVFWLLFLFGIVMIFLTSYGTGILTTTIRLILLPVFCIFGFMAGIVGTIFIIIGFIIFGNIFSGIGNSKDKKVKAQGYESENQNPSSITDSQGVEWKKGVGDVYHREGGFLGSGSKLKGEIF